MIDIHCHILPDVDDGAVDMTESVEMLRIAAECGVTDIIATPHCAPGEFDNYAGEKLFAAFSELCEALSKTGAEIGLHLGTEVFACPETLKLTDSGKLLTLADSDFMLVECAFDEDPWFMLEMLQTVAASGKKPVVAHPERYYFVQDDLRYALEWAEAGYSLQINTGSLTGYFGRDCRRTAFKLLNSGAVMLAASDAHGAKSRTTDMRKAYKTVVSEFSKEYADLIFYENPARLLKNKTLKPIGQILAETARGSGFLSDEEYWGI